MTPAPATPTQNQYITGGGPLMQCALQAIYTLALICLLHSDEVLKVHRDHVEFVIEDDGTEYMILTLPF